MIIFVEGVDGSGKSTLVDKLRRVFGYQVATLPPQLEDKECERQIWGKFLDKSRKQLLIADRGPFTEIIYRLIKDLQDTYINEAFLEWLLCTPIAVIHCQTTSSYQDAMARGEVNVVSQVVHDDIRAAYEQCMAFLERFTSVPVFRYDWKNVGINDVVKFINTVGGNNAI